MGALELAKLLRSLARPCRMALGMTLLALQFLLQIAEALARGPAAAGFADPKVGLGPDLVRAKKQDTKDSAR